MLVFMGGQHHEKRLTPIRTINYCVHPFVNLKVLTQPPKGTFIASPTVDGRYPAPPGMHKELCK